MSFDAKLRKRIAWLNKAGGFDNQISYSKVAEAADGLDGGKVIEILKYLEDNWDKVWDPTAWVCSSLLKAKNASTGLEVNFDAQLRRRIRWLNNAGGFDNMIIYTKVADAAVGLDKGKVMEILKYLEERWHKVDDPTAWVCSALRKAGEHNGDGSTGSFDEQLRRRIRWLNNAGGFGNVIVYSKVAEAAEGVDNQRVFEILLYLEENWRKIRDPTSWICSSLERASNANVGLNADFDKRLRRRIRWLNSEGGFNNTIVYSKIVGATIGVEDEQVMEILRLLEDRGEKVEDPTAWVCSALGKAGSSGGARWLRGGNTQRKGATNGDGGVGGAGGNASGATGGNGPDKSEGAGEDSGRTKKAVSTRRYQDSKSKAKDPVAQEAEEKTPEPQLSEGGSRPQAALELSKVSPKGSEDMDMVDLP